MESIVPEKTQAILIGASKFDFGKDDGFQDLPSVNTNLSKLNLLLIEVVCIDKKNIHLLSDRDNSNTITSEITDIVSKVLDTVIVYYAGHGIRKEQKHYLATKITKFKEPESTGALESNYLVNLVIKKTKAKNIIFIIDCCFSSMAKEGVNSQDKNVFFITATASTQTAKDESEIDKSYTAFTCELLKILENGIDGAGKFLTVQDISNHLEKQLADKKLPEPKISSHGSPDKLEICKNRAYKTDASGTKKNETKSKKLNYVLYFFIGIILIVILNVVILNWDYIKIVDEHEQNVPVTNKELHTLGASNTLQIKAILENNKIRYGSATVWEKNAKHIIIVTAYHVLERAKKFEILAPHYDLKTNNFGSPKQDKNRKSFKIPSLEVKVYAKLTYDLVLIKITLNGEFIAKYPWLSVINGVKKNVKICSSSLKNGETFQIFGFPKSKFIHHEQANFKEETMGRNIYNIICSKTNMRTLLFKFEPKDGTKKGMGGGPVLDTNGCFHGILIGKIPDKNPGDGDSIVVDSKDIYQISRLAEFKAFDKNKFIEKNVFCTLE